MRVLHIFDHSIPLHSGYSFRSMAIVRGQRKMGWETFHLTSAKHTEAAGYVGARESVDGLEFYRTPAPKGVLARLPVANQWAVAAATLRRLRALIPELQPDVLHAHSPALNGIAAVRAGREFDIPVVYEVRAFWEDAAVDHGTSKEWGLRYRLTRALESRVLARADGVVTICEGLRNEIAGRGIDAAKIAVVPNAVDADQFQFASEEDPALRRELGLEGQTVVGFVGSFYAYEGLDLLVRAFPAVLQRRPQSRLLLVGGGPQEENLKALADSLGLGSKVLFVGRVPHAEVKKYYDLIDVLAYPRLDMRLTDLVTPLKPLEAMAQGKLLVASDVGGHRELIEDGVTGSLFRAGQPEALAQAIVELIEHPDWWPDRRSAGRAFVERERNWPGSVARYRDIYGRVLGRTIEGSTQRAG